MVSLVLVDPRGFTDTLQGNAERSRLELHVADRQRCIHQLQLADLFLLLAINDGSPAFNVALSYCSAHKKYDIARHGT